MKVLKWITELNYKVKSKGTTYYIVSHCMKDMIKWASE